MGQPVVFFANFDKENPDDLNLVVTDKDTRLSYTCSVEIVDEEGKPLILDDYRIPIRGVGEDASDNKSSSESYNTAKTSVSSASGIRKGIFSAMRDKFNSFAKMKSGQDKKGGVKREENDDNRVNVKILRGNWHRSCTLATFGTF